MRHHSLSVSSENLDTQLLRMAGRTFDPPRHARYIGWVDPRSFAAVIKNVCHLHALRRGAIIGPHTTPPVHVGFFSHRLHERGFV